MANPVMGANGAFEEPVYGYFRHTDGAEIRRKVASWDELDAIEDKGLYLLRWDNGPDLLAVEVPYSVDHPDSTEPEVDTGVELPPPEVDAPADSE